MKKLGGALGALVLLVAGLAVPAAAAHIATVTTGADGGPGSLREALASGATHIEIDSSVGDIAIASTLVYSGTAPLTIVGTGQTVDGGSLDDTLLEISEGADVTIENLGFDDGGAQTLDSGSGEPGIHVAVPATRTGAVDVVLRDLTVRGVGGHGVWIDDNLSSPASIRLVTRDVVIDRAGIGDFDRDGIRVDETGDGHIRWTSRGDTYVEVGADGVELDERGPGNVVIDVRDSRFDRNGGYCAPLDPIAAGVVHPCVEDDDGELVLDLDDGFDIDEAGPGSIRGRVRWSELHNNLDEGLDFDEEDDGGVDVTVRRTNLTGNTDEGIKISEENNGDNVVELDRVSVRGNDSDGVEIEEEDAGDTEVEVEDSEITGNDGDGLKIEEAGDGDLAAEVEDSEITGNDSQGIQAEQEDAGVGEIEIDDTDLSGNAGGPTNLIDVALV